MDFARPVAFKNADIGRCAYQKPREDEEDAGPAEVVVQPQPAPVPAFPSPTPTVAHVSVHIDTAFEPSVFSPVQKGRWSSYLVDSALAGAPGVCL